MPCASFTTHPTYMHRVHLRSGTQETYWQHGVVGQSARIERSATGIYTRMLDRKGKTPVYLGLQGNAHAGQDASSAKHTVGTTFDRIHPIQATMVSFLAVTMLACPILFQPYSAIANDNITQEWKIQPEHRSYKALTPRQEIPPGRITILQWLSRIKIRYLPDRVNIKTAVMPTVAEMTRIGQEAANDLKRPFPDVFMKTPELDAQVDEDPSLLLMKVK